MKIIISLFAIVSLLIFGCQKQKGEISYTYNKAVAVYGDLEEIRNQPLSGVSSDRVSATKVFYGTDFILIGEKEKGIHVLNNSNYRNLSPQGFINLPYLGEFYVQGSFLYLEQLYDLVKIDISNPYHPQLVNRTRNAIRSPFLNASGESLIGFEYHLTTESFELGSEKEKMLRKNNNLFFDFNNELIPESNIPSSFLGTDSKKGAANKMAYYDSHLYIINSSSIMTFSDNNSGLLKTCVLSLSDRDNELETIYLQGNRLFIGSNRSSYILSAFNSICPSLISEYKRPKRSEDPILPNGNVAYLTLNGSDNELQVLDVSNPSEIEIIGRLNMKSPQGLALISDRFLLIGEGSNGMELVDVADATSPSTLGEFPSFRAHDIMVHPTLENVVLTIYDNKITQYLYHPLDNSFEFLSDLYVP